MARINLTIKRAVLVAGLVIAGVLAFVVYASQSAGRSASGSPLTIDVSKGQQGSIEYVKVLVTNNSDKTFTNVIVDMGPAGRATIPELPPHETFDASPTSLEGVSEIRVTTDQGISVTKSLS